MATPPLQTYTYRDANGYVATVRIFVVDAPAGTALEGPLNETTNAVIQAVHGPYSPGAFVLDYGAAATYQNIEDKAVMVFRAIDGTLHTVRIPAPKATDFETDQDQVKKTDAAISAFVDQYLVSALTPSGGTMDSFVGGYRSRTKSRRRRTVFQKNI